MVYLKRRSSLLNESPVCLSHLVALGTRNSLDSSCTGSDTCLGYDSELTSLSCRLKMCTAAELKVESVLEVAYGNNSYRLAVLLTEDSDGTELLSLIDAHLLSDNRQILQNYIINYGLNLIDLFLSHCLEVVEVES